jgi:hypothetical protein
MKRNNLLKLLIALFIVVVVLLAIDIWFRLNCKPTSRESSQHMVIPIEFMYKYPDCANNFLQAMNATHIKIVPQNSTNTLVQNIRLQLQNYSRK